MAFNRAVDRNFDALNPRIQKWKMPQGRLAVGETVMLIVVASVIFVFAAYQLSWICFLLSPVALGITFFTS